MPALSLTWNESADVVAEASRIYVFERLPHHLALLALPKEEYTARFVRHGLLLVVLVALGTGLRHHAAFRIVQFAWGAALLALVGLAIELVWSHEPLFAARLLRYYWYRLSDFGVPAAAALAATALACVAMSQRKAFGTWGLLASVLYTGWYLGDVASKRVLNPVPPADARMADFKAWTDACDWIAANTSASSLFLTPRLNHSFKWRTGRPEVVNRKDIPQDARGILEWNRRIKEIYYYDGPAGLVGPIDSLGQLGDERVRELARKYGADYVLSDRSQLLSLPQRVSERGICRLPSRKLKRLVTSDDFPNRLDVGMRNHHRRARRPSPMSPEMSYGRHAGPAPAPPAAPQWLFCCSAALGAGIYRLPNVRRRSRGMAGRSACRAASSTQANRPSQRCSASSMRNLGSAKPTWKLADSQIATCLPAIFS